MREPDKEVPEQEVLYRGLKSKDVDEYGRVALDAIDLEGTSCHRCAYMHWTVARVKPEWPGLAATQPKRLPREPIIVDNASSECFVHDCPSEKEGEAHVEIRFRRVSDRPNTKNVKPSNSVKREMRTRIARAFRVLKAPPAEPPIE